MGGAICRAALAQGLKVTSLNRTGKPQWLVRQEPWINDVEWIAGGCYQAGHSIPRPASTL